MIVNGSIFFIAVLNKSLNCKNLVEKEIVVEVVGI